MMKVSEVGAEELYHQILAVTDAKELLYNYRMNCRVKDLPTSSILGFVFVSSVNVAHGTVQRHYYKHLKGERTSTNSVATLFAWTGALRKRGEMDGLDDLIKFADNLEKATIQTIEEGVMTGDLAALSTLENKQKVDTEEFLLAVNERLQKLM